MEHLIKHNFFLPFYFPWNQITPDTMPRGINPAASPLSYQTTGGCRVPSPAICSCSLLSNAQLFYSRLTQTLNICSYAMGQESCFFLVFFQITQKCCTLLLKNSSSKQGNSCNENHRITNLSLKYNLLSVSILSLCLVISTWNSLKLMKMLTPY